MGFPRSDVIAVNQVNTGWPFRFRTKQNWPDMEIPRDWQLTRRFRCPTCGKRYAVVEWKHDPKCRQCGDSLRSEDATTQAPPKSQAANQ